MAKTKMVYIYRLYVTLQNGKIIRTFLGNDKNEMLERFEIWLIKQGYDRVEIKTSFDYVQHA